MTRYQWRHHLSGLIGMSHTEVLPMEEKGNKGNTCNTTLGVSVRWTPRRWVGRWSCGVLIPPTMLTTCRGRLNCLCNYYYGTTTTTATELITAVCKHYHWCACVQCANVEAAAAFVTTTTSEPSMKIPLPKPTSAQCATSTIHCALCLCKRGSCCHPLPLVPSITRTTIVHLLRQSDPQAKKILIFDIIKHQFQISFERNIKINI